MIEPMIALSMSLHANPGVYAVLLGSGVSRAADIPTGWDVVLNLIRKIAKVYDEDCEPNPDAWYVHKFEKEPKYSELLEAIGKSQAERTNLLKGYFEPTDEELEEGKKQPTEAHKAIAHLVKQGYIRVILSTNFDRLMERALDSINVAPTVISIPEALEGAMPIAHSDCTLFKLSGDYLDLRTKNTPIELSDYDSRINNELDRIFNEYGLIICGWSGEWDEALRKAIKRCKNPRFTWWWTTLGEPIEAAQNIIDLRKAEVITIKGADEFFQELSKKVDALREKEQPHPISIKNAVSLAKKYLSDVDNIKLNDLMMQEVEKIYKEVSSERYPINVSFRDDDYEKRIIYFEFLTEIAAHIMATGTYWEKPEHMDIWTKAINHLVNYSRMDSYNRLMFVLRLYPAKILLYAGGIGAVAKDKYAILYDLFNKPKVSNIYEEKSLVESLSEQGWHEVFRKIKSLESNCVPVSFRLFEILRNPLKDIIPDDGEYEKYFYLFEVIQSFHSAHVLKGWPMGGRYMYSYKGKNICDEFIREIENKGGESKFLKAGFCNGSMEEWNAARNCVFELYKQRIRN